MNSTIKYHNNKYNNNKFINFVKNHCNNNNNNNSNTSYVSSSSSSASSSSLSSISSSPYRNTKIELFRPTKDIILRLQDYVYVSKDCSRKLGEYIVSENWGIKYCSLYKYLDYIFRCQVFKKQVICVNNKYLIFHTGLQRRYDNEFLYALLIPNKKSSATQKYRVQFGNIRNSFVSKNELLSKFNNYLYVSDYLPNRTIFVGPTGNKSEFLFNDKYNIDINWETILTAGKDRIHKLLGNTAFFDNNAKFMRLTALVNVFDNSLKRTLKIAKNNPRLAVAQGFVDTKNCDFRMELLLPLNIEYPVNSKKYYMFALALCKVLDTLTYKYVAKSILKINMAYNNARLVGYVDSSWLNKIAFSS